MFTVSSFLASVHRPGAFQTATWQTIPTRAQAADSRKAGHTLLKISEGTIRTGIDYGNTAAVRAAVEAGEIDEPGPLQDWAEWIVEGYAFRHVTQGTEYVRLFVVPGTVRTRYFVDNVEVSCKDFDTHLQPAQRSDRRKHSLAGIMTLALSNLIHLKVKDDA